VRREEWPDYRKWLSFYLDFCSKYGHPPDSKESLPRFLFEARFEKPIGRLTGASGPVRGLVLRSGCKAAARAGEAPDWVGATDMSIYEASVCAERRLKVQAAQAQAKTMLVKAFANQRPRAAAKAA
jgi:hypothetical protein